jgi:hypothetical protein
MNRYVAAVAFCIVVPFMALAQVPAQGVIGGSSAPSGGGSPAVCSTGTATNVMVIGSGPTCSETSNLTVNASTTTWTGSLRSSPTSTSSLFLYGLGAVHFFSDTTNADGFYYNLDSGLDWRMIRRVSLADTVALFLDTATGNFAVGNNTSPVSLFNVGSSSQFQVDSSGVIVKERGATPTGTCTLNGGSPSTCTSTVAAGSICTCSPVGTTAGIAAGGCAVSLSSTTLTVTSHNGHTNAVNWHCF